MSYRPVHLRCEYLLNPLGVDKPRPRLSWEGESERVGARQAAWQIQVASSPAALQAGRADLWDSGEIASAQSLHTPYDGKPLKTHQLACWRVRVRDADGELGDWSELAQWTMGLLKQADWRARWIGIYLGSHHSVPLFRREFETRSDPQRALLYVSALGLAHLTINGREVSEDCLLPGWTDYRKRRLYRCYDVTKLLKAEQANCLGAELAEGWFKGQLGWLGQSQHYGGQPALLAQLHIDYERGHPQLVATNAQWKCRFGPTLRAGLYEGESVDAQLEPRGWNKVGFDDSDWAPVTLREEAESQPPVPLESHPAEPVRRTETLRPVRCWAVAPGKYCFDFGQNIAGRVRLQCPGKAGAVVRLRFGEVLQLDGSLYVENLRTAFATDTYVMKGAKREVWEPKFTFHGFRYCEVSGLPEKPTCDHLLGIVLGTDTRRVGHFECSNPMVNQLYANALWTQRANFLEIPTDCPQRDERLGWTGDAQVFIRTAISNMDVAAFFTKWLRDLSDGQYADGAFPNVAPNVLDETPWNIGRGDAAWADAGIICPWILYACYEDRELLREHYPAMKRYLRYLDKHSKHNLRGPKQAQCFGDWLSIGADTPVEVIQSAHYAQVTRLLGKIAGVLGKKKEAARYQERFETIRKAFRKAFVSGKGRVQGDTQTGYLLALAFDLLSKKERKAAARHLVEDIHAKGDHSSTGFVGTALILPVLHEIGELELAYKLLENTSYPSWGFSVVNGATTIWERWNSWTEKDGPGDVNMNSYSHYAYGAVAQWLYDTVAGIRQGEVGFRHVRLCPCPGGSLEHASARFHSPYGEIQAAWKREQQGYTYAICIPPNTTATVELPVASLEGVTIDDQPLAQHAAVQKRRKRRFDLPAGRFCLRWSSPSN